MIKVENEKKYQVDDFLWNTLYNYNISISYNFCVISKLQVSWIIKETESIGVDATSSVYWIWRHDDVI